MIRVSISFFIALVFLGCTTANKSSVIYEEYKPHKSPEETTIKEKKQVIKKILPTNGTIKGNVTKLTFSEGFWHYEVKSNDITNQKLSVAKFISSEKVAKKGDFVYAIIKNDRLKEIFLIKKANYKREVIKKTTKKKKKYQPKKHKRTKKYQVLGVPTVESISLD